MNIRLIIVVSIAVMICWTSQWHWAQTIDEPQHLWAGTRILQQFDFSRFDNSKMPVSVVNAAGWLLSQSPGVQGSWFWARVPQVVWLIGVIVVVFLWARQHVKEASALAVAALVAFDPNLIAHSGVVTTDLPCTFGVLWSCFLWSRVLQSPNRRNAVWAGVAIGFAQATKFTALFLGPILGLTTLLWCFSRRSMAPLRQIPMALLVAIVTLNLSYGFSGTGTKAGDIVWKSSTFQPLAQSPVPLPVPRPWIEGVDWVKHDDDVGQGRVYADGQKSHFGRSDHYARTLPRKWPLPLLVLSVGGLMVMGRRRGAWVGAVTVVVPAAFFLLWFSLAFNSQVGNRYVLPAVPFLALWAIRLPIRWLQLGVVWTLLSTLSWWPWGLSYFNETVVDRSQVWRIVADSDLDWGQADGVAESWLQDNPGGLFNPDVPAPGPMLIGANRLTGVLGHPARMACLREHLPPDRHLAGALYPMQFETKDFERCFPAVHMSHGDGPLPAGQHVLILRFVGTASVTVGEHSERVESDDETLIGVVVYADTPFAAQWTIPDNGTVYLNGEVIDGIQAP